MTRHPPLDTLADVLPLEMARVRDRVLPRYLALGQPGAFAATLIRANLDAAARALAEGNVLAMSGAYSVLRLRI